MLLRNFHKILRTAVFKSSAKRRFFRNLQYTREKILCIGLGLFGKWFLNLAKLTRKLLRRVHFPDLLTVILALRGSSPCQFFFFFLKNVVIIHLMIDLRSKSPCSVRMQENTDQKNSEYGQFLGSGNLQWLCILASKRFWCLQHYQENDVYSGKLSTVKPLFIIITSCKVINCKAFQKINKLQKVWSCCNSQDNH